MALEKSVSIDKIEIVMTEAGYPVIQVRESTVVKEDGVPISGKAFSRSVIMPDEAVDHLPANVQAMAAAMFDTPAKAAYAVKKAADVAVQPDKPVKPDVPANPKAPIV